MVERSRRLNLDLSEKELSVCARQAISEFQKSFNVKNNPLKNDIPEELAVLIDRNVVMSQLRGNGRLTWQKVNLFIIKKLGFKEILKHPSLKETDIEDCKGKLTQRFLENLRKEEGGCKFQSWEQVFAYLKLAFENIVKDKEAALKKRGVHPPKELENHPAFFRTDYWSFVNSQSPEKLFESFKEAIDNGWWDNSKVIEFGKFAGGNSVDMAADLGPTREKLENEYGLVFRLAMEHRRSGMQGREDKGFEDLPRSDEPCMSLDNIDKRALRLIDGLRSDFLSVMEPIERKFTVFCVMNKSMSISEFFAWLEQPKLYAKARKSILEWTRILKNAGLDAETTDFETIRESNIQFEDTFETLVEFCRMQIPPYDVISSSCLEKGLAPVEAIKAVLPDKTGKTIETDADTLISCMMKALDKSGVANTDLKLRAFVKTNFRPLKNMRGD